LCISSFYNAELANDLPSGADDVLISGYLRRKNMKISIRRFGPIAEFIYDLSKDLIVTYERPLFYT